MTALIYKNITGIAKEVSAIGKTQSNKQQGFKYRGIDDVYFAIQPLLAKHEVFTVPNILSERSEERQTKAGGTLIYRVLHISYKFYATDGSFVECSVIGEGMDSGDKAANKAMAIGHKYAILQTFCIPTDEVKDPDAESHEVSPRSTQTAPQTAAGGNTSGDKQMSPAQRKFIKTIGNKDCGMSDDDVVSLVKWKAEQMNVDPNHYSVARAFLGDSKKGDVPKDVFSCVLLEWENAMETDSEGMESGAMDSKTKDMEEVFV